jgi:hypothetical protein
MFKLLVVLAVVGGGAYYYYTQNPQAFGGAGNTISNDASHMAGKARNLR